MEKGINKTFKNIRIVEIAPVEIMGEKWLCVGFEEKNINRGDNLHLALILNSQSKAQPDNLVTALREGFKKRKKVIVRIHSECILGDALYSDLCDCGSQLKSTFELITKEGAGVVLYLRQEGRSIGLRNKLACLAIQEGYVKGEKITHKHTPDEANIAMGHPIDNRSYGIAADFLNYIGLTTIRFISGNPQKIAALNKNKIKIKDFIYVSRVKLTKRALLEIKEKISRNYNYPGMKEVKNVS